MQRTMTKTDQSKIKSEAPADGSRRYSEGTFPSYDAEYDRLFSRSSVLKSNKNSTDTKNAFRGEGIGNCQRDLIQLVGNNDGMYKDGKNWSKALIPAAKSNLKTVFRDFARWQRKQVQDGKALTPPETWPDGLLQERLKAEARLDVRRAEKVFLENRIKYLKGQQGKIELDEPMLPSGPVCNISKNPKGTRIVSVDGQKVSHSQGVPYVEDERSPYDGMPIATYRQMSKAWMKENRITRSQLLERRNEYKQKLKEAGEKIPPSFSVHKFERMLKQQGDWPEHPEWPKGAKKITEIQT